jgi:cardiolipin synthase
LLAGATDVVDGYLARRCNQITPLGKILDPLADKLMQVAVAICLWVRFPQLWLFVLLLAAKETLQIWRACWSGGGASSWPSKMVWQLYTVCVHAATLEIIAYPQLGNQVSGCCWCCGAGHGVLRFACMYRCFAPEPQGKVKKRVNL